MDLRCILDGSEMHLRVESQIHLGMDLKLLFGWVRDAFEDALEMQLGTYLRCYLGWMCAPFGEVPGMHFRM